MADLLAAVPAYAVQDITATAALAETDLAAVRSVTTPAQVHPGPVFEGSLDADWIGAGLLVDVKATIAPRGLDTAMIYQLLGYVLLDYLDQYRITDVGW